MSFKAVPSVSPEEAGQIPYPYVYVNENGSVRELHESERKYLEEPFDPTDGARPYVKLTFQSRTPTGSVRGFCSRTAIPAGLAIGPAPAQDPHPPISKAEHIAQLRKQMVGFEVIERPDGSVQMKRVAPPPRKRRRWWPF
jgi:hypothetical protein